MPIDVTEATFQSEVLDRSRQVPVVVDFWAEWCGPCRQLGPALEAAEAARAGKVVLAKVDTDANQRLAAGFGIQGIPAVKAFRDGKVASEFVGAVPKAQVEAFFDSLIPSRADELLARGDELALREAAELEPRRADIAVALGRARLERGALAEALEAVEGHPGDFAAAGIAARVRLTAAGIGTDAFAALDRGQREVALNALLDTLDAAPGAAATPAEHRATSAAGEAFAGGDGASLAEDVDPAIGARADGSAPRLDATERRELLRQAIVGILSELDPADPNARAYRRRLAAALP